MAILIRMNSQWRQVERFDFPDETHLQRLLHDSPELIPLANVDSAVFIREANLPGSGYTDLLGVDADGNILVIETKLARNQEIRRKVLGQILEYGAFLWSMSYEVFDGLFLAKTGKHLMELVVAKNPSVVPELFRSTISENLSAGNFHLLIAVDEINDELERVIAYMSHMGGVRLEAIELHYYKTDGADIVVPHRHGQPVLASASAGSSAKKLTFDQIVSSFADDKARAMFLYISDGWREAGHEIAPGTKGASFKARVGDDPQSIFWAFPNQWGLEPLFGQITKQGAPIDVVSAYRNAVAALPAFDSTKALAQKFTSAKFENLSLDQVERFLAASLEVVKAWRAAIV